MQDWPPEDGRRNKRTYTHTNTHVLLESESLIEWLSCAPQAADTPFSTRLAGRIGKRAYDDIQGHKRSIDDANRHLFLRHGILAFTLRLWKLFFPFQLQLYI